MNKKTKLSKIFYVLLVLSFALGSNSYLINSVKGETTRTGAWVDALNFSVVDSDSSISSIKDGKIDIFANGLSTDNYSEIVNNPSIDSNYSNGLYYELSLNPAEFYDTTKLNPFSDQKIREAMNWLIDRNFLNQTYFNNLSFPKYFPIDTGNVEYSRYLSKVTELEKKYAYNLPLADSIISTRMLSLGASKLSGKWHFKGKPVTINLIIREDSDLKRIPLGNYVADQLEIIGFTTERLFMTAAEASPIWLGGDPADGAWHIYTGAWSSTAISRNEGDIFEFFNSPSSAYGFSGLWQAYNPTAEFEEIMEKLAYNNFASFEERDTLFNQALELELEFSVRIWLLDGKIINPRRSTVTLTYDKAGGMSTRLWPYTIRNREFEGGQINIGIEELSLKSWNPMNSYSSGFGGDDLLKTATTDFGIVWNPRTGLEMPQRIESAEIYAKSGLPIYKTMDWIDLYFEDAIFVPDDAWVDWDAEEQVFIQADQADPNINRNALIKSIVRYPVDLFEKTKWHDGSSLSISDFIFAMIIQYDRTKEESKLYDESAFIRPYILGFRIVQNNPLIIETYLDAYGIDAETNVVDWWPVGNSEPIPWHTTALGVWAEEENELTFSEDKANALNIGWMDYLDHDCTIILNNHLEIARSSTKYPYTQTMKNYLTETEVIQRWENLHNWYIEYGHFWVGNGPFYVDQYDRIEKTLRLSRFGDFPDHSDKWVEFEEGSLQSLAVNYNEGAPGSTFLLLGQGYPPNSTATISLNFKQIGNIQTDSTGNFKFTLKIPEEVNPGLILITVSVNPTHSIWINITPEAQIIEKEFVVPDHFEPADIPPLQQIFLPFTTK